MPPDLSQGVVGSLCAASPERHFGVKLCGQSAAFDEHEQLHLLVPRASAKESRSSSSVTPGKRMSVPKRR